jgi:CheY-like chemotaxis protein
VKVLIVEDEASIRRVLARVVRTAFDEVTLLVAESVDEAVDLLTQAMVDESMVDFVISDFNLLGTRTGAELLEWVRAHASYLENRFLFFSGNPEVEKLHRHVVAKGESPTLLVTTMKEMLARAE